MGINADGEFSAHQHGDVAVDHFGAGNPGLDGHGRLNGQAIPALDEGIAGKRGHSLCALCATGPPDTRKGRKCEGETGRPLESWALRASSSRLDWLAPAR